MEIERAASAALSSEKKEAAVAKTEKRRKDVEFVLNHPVFLDVSEPIRKMRSHLMIASTAALFSVLMGFEVSPATSISGIQFTGLSQTKISICLLCITSYMLIHFVWSSWDGFQEWRIRCSGAGIAFDRSAVGVDPREVSLMTWWTAQVEGIGRQLDSVNRYRAQFEAVNGPINADSGVVQDRAVLQTINHLSDYANGMMQLYKGGVSVPNEKTLRDQLERFELVFKRFLVSQNRRWIFIEFLTPVLLGVAAIGLLLTDLNWNPFLCLSVI